MFQRDIDLPKTDGKLSTRLYLKESFSEIPGRFFKKKSLKKKGYKAMHDKLGKLLMDVAYICGSKDLM